MTGLVKEEILTRQVELGYCIENGKLAGDSIIARHHGDFSLVPIEQVQYMDIAPSQMVGVSAVR